MTPNRKKSPISRRKFLTTTGCAALGYTTLFSSLLSMKAIGAAVMDKKAAFPGDYKALVCLLLSGGADSHNMLIPRSTAEHNEYLITRSNLAIPKSEVLSLNHQSIGNKKYGVHPNMPLIRSMFNISDLAFISNVGTLVEPVTKAQYQSNNVVLPLGLYSHSDQSKLWQTGRPGERDPHGWGGRIADMMMAQNGNENISMNITLSGNNFFQNGYNTSQYAISPSGSLGLTGYDMDYPYHQTRNLAIDNMLDRDYADIYEKTYADIFRKSKDGNAEYKAALDAVPEFATVFSSNELSQQFKMVAKTIAARQTLGFSRQTFFIDFRGWDHHDDVVALQSQKLPALDSALSEFNAVLKELGVHNDVTTFTGSDFGRTLTSNGDGSDHAWGGNVMVMGGAVNGKQIYGNYPSLALNNNQMLDRGVMIPDTSASEYLAELAMWFGVSSGDLVDLFPDLPNFYDISSGSYPIGFMNNPT